MDKQKDRELYHFQTSSYFQYPKITLFLRWVRKRRLYQQSKSQYLKLSPASMKKIYNKIEYNNETRQNNINVKRGSQQETASLNINLKTISKSYLLQYLQNLNDQQQTLIIHEYINEKANFRSTRKLFGADLEETDQNQSAHQQIKDFMIQVYSNSNFVRKIMCNEKMDLKSKRIFIKFLEKIRKSAVDPKAHTLWKERF